MPFKIDTDGFLDPQNRRTELLNILGIAEALRIIIVNCPYYIRPERIWYSAYRQWLVLAKQKRLNLKHTTDS
jgi:hypothetical protein